MRLSLLDFVSTPNEVLELAQLVDQLGCFERLWIGEHHARSQVPDPLLLAMLAAGTTSTIRLGTGASSLVFRSPYLLAETALTAELFFPGRIDLGVTKAASTSKEIFECLTDGLDLRAVFETYEQRVKLLRDLLLRTAPVESPLSTTVERGPPMYVMATREERARHAGALGVGIAVSLHHGATVGDARDIIAAYRDSFEPSPLFAAPYAIAVVSGYVSTSVEALAESMSNHEAWVRKANGVFRREALICDEPKQALRRLAELNEETGADETMFLALSSSGLDECYRALAEALIATRRPEQ